MRQGRHLAFTCSQCLQCVYLRCSMFDTQNIKYVYVLMIFRCHFWRWLCIKPILTHFFSPALIFTPIDSVMLLCLCMDGVYSFLWSWRQPNTISIFFFSLCVVIYLLVNLVFIVMIERICATFRPISDTIAFRNENEKKWRRPNVTKVRCCIVRFAFVIVWIFASNATVCLCFFFLAHKKLKYEVASYRMMIIIAGSW